MASIPAISWSTRAPTRRRATANFSTIGRRAGWPQKPNIAYCTVVYVDETDDKAIETALFRASRAYEGFLAPPKPGETFEHRVARTRQDVHRPRRARRLGDHAAPVRPRLSVQARSRLHRLARDRRRKIRAAADAGVFNTFMGEFNFSDLPEPELMRSIRLFGEKVIPALRGYEPF